MRNSNRLECVLQTCNDWRVRILGTSWHAEYYAQRLGPPKGPAVLTGKTSWHREFAHATVDLDCRTRKNTITGWNLPPPPSPPPPPPPRPPAPAKGQWGAAWYCNSCSKDAGALLKDLGRNISFAACKAACEAELRCHFINFGFGPAVEVEACQLYVSCTPGWDGKPQVKCNAIRHDWWTTYEYGRGKAIGHKTDDTRPSTTYI